MGKWSTADREGERLHKKLWLKMDHLEDMRNGEHAEGTESRGASQGPTKSAMEACVRLISTSPRTSAPKMT